MPGPLVVIADTALKLVTGFALGFLARDITKRGKGKSKPSSGKTKTSKAAGVTKAAPVTKTLNFRPGEELKMVLCVNEDLKMGKGKIGAQCAHAAMGVYQESRSTHERMFTQWGRMGQAKIALKVQDEVEMAELEAKAASLGIPTYIVHDAGRTQIPEGSQTVLAIGPAPKSVIDQVTGHLRLL